MRFLTLAMAADTTLSPYVHWVLRLLRRLGSKKTLAALVLLKYLGRQ